MQINWKQDGTIAVHIMTDKFLILVSKSSFSSPFSLLSLPPLGTINNGTIGTWIATFQWPSIFTILVSTDLTQAHSTIPNLTEPHPSSLNL